MNKRKMMGAHSALALLALAVSQVHAADATVQQGREDRAEKAAQKTLAKMTMEEKAGLHRRHRRLGRQAADQLRRSADSWR
ncbi:Beta-glucosidase [Pseudomonas syringae pv. cilantro]|nr:Beta-glucosidase [Pseudomonas syringae pv. cilantro]